MMKFLRRPHLGRTASTIFQFSLGYTSYAHVEMNPMVSLAWLPSFLEKPHQQCSGQVGHCTATTATPATPSACRVIKYHKYPMTGNK